MAEHVVVTLEGDELVAELPDGRTLADADAVQLADLLLAEGVSANQVQMPDWREGDRAPSSGQKVALFTRMRQDYTTKMQYANISLYSNGQLWSNPALRFTPSGLAAMLVNPSFLDLIRLSIRFSFAQIAEVNNNLLEVGEIKQQRHQITASMLSNIERGFGLIDSATQRPER